mmetsp:Transcript_30178/g.30663  ORF Transcript_30178/g.30663 Transcript_30178/m.30663 type:complete len:261 (+) Transcript_30178:240-1022(+)
MLLKIPCTKIDGQNARFHAILSSYMNIIAGVIELTLAIRAGADEESFSMFGVALMTFVDLSGSILVLIRWQWLYSPVIDHQAELLREMKLSCILGCFMTLLGVFLLNKCMWALLERSSPSDLSEGLLVSILGTLSSLLLAYYKYVVGKKLDSYVVVTDAMCSLCVGLTCVSSLLVFALNRVVWWADGAIGLIVALYTLHSGVHTVLYSYPQYKYLSQVVMDGVVMCAKEGETTRLLLHQDDEEENIEKREREREREKSDS